jgi:hypothetical protein
VGALFVAVGAIAAFGIPRLRRMAHPEMQPEAAPIGDGPMEGARPLGVSTTD